MSFPNHDLHADDASATGARHTLRARSATRSESIQPGAGFLQGALLQAFGKIAADITRMAFDGEEPPVLFERVTTLITKALDVPFGVVLRYHPKDESLIPLSATGWQRDVSALFASPGEATSFLNQALKATEAVMITDLRADANCHVNQALTDCGVVSALCAAIQGPDRPLGLLAVFTNSGRKFEHDECCFLWSVANLLAVTVGSRYATESQMQGHEQIAQAKREWESTVDSLPGIVVCLLDSSGNILRANRAVERWTFERVGEVKGKSLHDLLHPKCDNPMCYFMHLTQRSCKHLSQGQTVECDVEDIFLKRHLRIQFRPIVTHHHLLRDGTRSTSAAVAVIQDITSIKGAEQILRDANEVLEQKVYVRTANLVEVNQKLVMEVEERWRVERDLWHSRERYRLLIDTMNEGFAGQNADGVLTYVNNRLCDMLGYSRDELIGHPITDFSDPARLDLVDRHLCGREVCQGCQGGHFEIEWVRKDGTRIYTNVSPKPILDPDGKNDGCFAVIMDITDRRKAEEKLRKSESELRMLSAQLLTAQEVERKRIASELHDGISQSLSALKFCLENSLGLFERYGIEKGMPVLRSLIPKMQQEIEEVRRISMGLRPSTLDDLGIVPTIAWFCREFRGIYHNIQLDTRIDIEEHQVPPRIKAVVYRIVQEGLNNVVKHAQANTVSIELRYATTMIELRISDNGHGFDLNDNTDQTGTGRGMGLSSMRERAENSGGSLSIASSRKSGTSITVSWPTHTAVNQPHDGINW